MTNVGTVIITCPGCGESLEVAVFPRSVFLSETFLQVELSQSRIDHACKGRP